MTTPLVYADLINDVYTINGVAQGAYTDIFMQEPGHPGAMIKNASGLQAGFSEDTDWSWPVSNTANAALTAALHTALTDCCVLHLEMAIALGGGESHFIFFTFGVSTATAGPGLSLDFDASPLPTVFTMEFNGSSANPGGIPGQFASENPESPLPTSLYLYFHPFPSTAHNTVVVNGGAPFVAAQETPAFVDFQDVFDWGVCQTDLPCYLTLLEILPCEAAIRRPSNVGIQYHRRRL